MRRLVLILAVLVLSLAGGWPAAAAPSDDCGVDGTSGSTNDSTLGVFGESAQCTSSAPGPAPVRATSNPKSSEPSDGRPADEPVGRGPRAGDDGSQLVSESCAGRMAELQCQAAAGTCAATSPDSEGPVAIIRQPGGQLEGYDCGATPGQPGPAVVAAPPVPTFGQIQQAFRELPFCKPSPSMQPVGGKTVVNLATYYEAGWPDGACLSPGETSAKVQLLSWSVEFAVEARDYRFSYGDGASSGWTTSTGGGYPDGDITHAYRDTGSVDVRVDARLTGSYRVDGGAWQDIETVADLQDEPAATYEVVEAKNRLQADPAG